MDRRRPEGLHQRQQVIVAQLRIACHDRLGHRPDGGHARTVMIKLALEVGLFVLCTSGFSPAAQHAVDLVD